MTIVEELSAGLGLLRGTAAADRLCELCVELIDIDAAAISLIFDGANNATLGVSSLTARHYDELQFTLGEGPCLSSVADRAPVLVPDLLAPGRSRWSAYAQAMAEMGVEGVFAMPVVVAGEYLGALDLFRHRRGDLTLEEIDGALAAAVLAELPLWDLLGDSLRATVTDPGGDAWEDLHMLTRFEVGRATGMLVSDLGVEPAEALVRLRAHAYSTLRSATAVARDILDRRLRLDS